MQEPVTSMCKSVLLSSYCSSKLLIESWRHADGKPGYDNTRYYAIQITATQFLDK